MVAGQSRHGVLSPARRAGEITTVLARVLLLNLLVAAAKIAYGLWTGAISMLSDGVHSLTDTASNAMGLVGVRVARRPADPSHPYGHRKFETLAAAGILVFLLLALVQVLEAAFGRLRSVEVPEVTPASFGVMIGTLAINLFVVRYEARAGRRLRSEVLIADAHHTRSDVFTSLAVIAALGGVWLGWPLLDPLVAIAIAGFVGHAGFQIAREASGVLADQVVLDAGEITRVVRSVPEAAGCHQIRTRGTADHVFLDLHVWFPGDMPLAEAHRLSHVVKDRLMRELPGLVDVVIHIEPPPR